MRNNILLICSLILFISVGFSQSKVLKVLDDIELTDSGVMLDNNNSANGYYFFYEADKVSRKEREFIVKILDQNLNEVLSKTFIESRSSYVMQAKYNNQELMFLMYNNDDHKFIFYTLDKEGNLNKVHEYEEGVKNHSIRLNSSPIMGSNLGFYPIKNKGFLFYLKTKPKKFGYRMDYFATNGGENWSHVSDEGQHELIEVLNVGEDGLVFQETIRKKLIGGGYKGYIKVLNPETGEITFQKEYDQEENSNQAWNNALIDNDNLFVIGEYWGEGDRVYRDDSKGLFIDKYTFSGEKIFSKKISWEDGFTEAFNSLNDEGGRNYLYFHDFIKTNNGHIYAIGEQYRKTLSARSLGSSQLTITDVFFLELDQEFNLVKVTKFDKGKSRVSSDQVGGNAHIQAMLMARLGGFDYVFTQIDKQNDRFYSVFIDYERIKGEKNKTAFKAIIYNNGKLTEDKVYLDKENSVERTAKAAKMGYVLLVDDDKKNKEVKLHLEKLNIE